MLKTLVGAMLLAAICALGVSQSLAGNAIADSAELVEPLRTGQRAPSFIVPDADGVEFAFNPDALQNPPLLSPFGVAGARTAICICRNCATSCRKSKPWGSTSFS